jgi:hypothetical protein
LRTSVRKGIEIIEALRGHTTGYAVPQYVIDAPGGGGKVPLGPEYVLTHDNERVLIRNYEGKVFEYPEMNELAGVPPSPSETCPDVVGAGAEPAVSCAQTAETGNGCHRATLD